MDQNLVGAQEIEGLLGVGRARVQQLVARPDFPAPVVTLGVGRIWRTADVTAWAEANGRQVNPPQRS